MLKYVIYICSIVVTISILFIINKVYKINNKIMMSKDTMFYVQTDSSMELITLDQGTFPGSSIVLITNDVKGAIQYINYMHDSKYDSSSFYDCSGITFSCSKYAPIMWLRYKPKNIEQLVTFNHEVTHLVRVIFNYYNVPITDDTDEVNAYEIGYLSRQFYKAIHLEIK